MIDSGRTFIGTELKFAFTIEAAGFSMEDDDFNIVIRGSKGSVELTKDDCFKDGEGNWYFGFDSAATGPGYIMAKFTAYVPDSDFDDGLRTEVEEVTLPIYVRR